jgi:phage gp36-like protein
MSYVALSDIVGELPESWRDQALDDDGDGSGDSAVWDQVAAAAGEDVDAYLGQRFAVPFLAPLPALVVRAARVFALDKLFRRRGIEESANPWAVQATEMRSKLNKVATGAEPLGPGYERERPWAAIVTEPTRAYLSGGRRAV